MIERHERNYPQAQEHYEASLRMAQKSGDLQPICEALQGMGINLHLIGRELRRNRDNLSDAIDKQIAAYQLIREALEKAGTADKARGLIADGLNRIAKIFREARHLHSAAESGKALPEVGEGLDQLDRMLADFQPPFEDEYRDSLVMKGPAFSELNYLEKAQRLFEISALLARSVNDHYREMDSLTETARLLMWLNQLDEALLIIHRLESVPASQAQSKVFKAASDLALAHLYFCQEKYPESLALFQDAISRLANMTGYPAYLLTDRVRDLEWRLRDLQPEQALAWCDALENAWENSQAISSRPDLRDTIERIRLEKQALSGG
jgi:tetratricopeptide (TPR) repeat protein